MLRASSSGRTRTTNDTLSEAVQKLSALNTALSSADYASFWAMLEGDDLYRDLVVDVTGFEELIRIRIAVTLSQTLREIQRSLLESWLNLRGSTFEHFIREVCGWTVEGDNVRVPLNRDNEAKGVVVREKVDFDMFARVVRRAFEQPA